MLLCLDFSFKTEFLCVALECLDFFKKIISLLIFTFVFAGVETELRASYTNIGLLLTFFSPEIINLHLLKFLTPHILNLGNKKGNLRAKSYLWKVAWCNNTKPFWKTLKTTSEYKSLLAILFQEGLLWKYFPKFSQSDTQRPLQLWSKGTGSTEGGPTHMALVFQAWPCNSEWVKEDLARFKEAAEAQAIYKRVRLPAWSSLVGCEWSLEDEALMEPRWYYHEL